MSETSIYDPPNPDTVSCVSQTIINNAKGKSQDSSEYKLLQEIQQNPNMIDLAVDHGAGNASKVQATCNQAIEFLQKGPTNWNYQAANSLWPNTNITPPAAPPPLPPAPPMIGGLLKKKTKKKVKKYKKRKTNKKRKSNKKKYTRKKYTRKRPRYRISL
tara:strand:- start:1051 stop:1527 length:477 start_codon:yes stop_codon:yes gene_type:complete